MAQQQISLGTKQPRRMFPQNEWIEGISDFNKIGGAYLWARGIDYRSEPSQLKLLPQALAEGQGVFIDLAKFGEQVVGRTVNIGASPNLIANGNFEINTTGWTLGADYTRASDDSYIGAFSIKQVSTTGSAVFSTASGSGLVVTPYADYELTFRAKVAMTAGSPPQLQVLGGSLSGPNLLNSAQVLMDTSGVWLEIDISFNALQYSSVFVVITNQAGQVTAHYDNFSLNQINSIATYVLGNQGNFYKRYSNATWVQLGQVPNSHGNGMAYYGEDDYIYLMGDHTVGRYGPISSGVPSLVADYLQSAGGVPTNTNSPQFIAANGDYWVKTSPTANVKITGDLAVEAFLKPASLPSVGNSMTLAGLWNDSGNQRAWKLDLFGISAFFGNGADSSLTISVNTPAAPIDAQCSGTSGTQILNANNASFAVGQKILIIQMQGSGYGTRQITTIQGYDSTNHLITTQDMLTFSYNSSGANRAQVIVVPQYTNVAINAIYSAKAWNGTVGGILVFFYNGTLSGSGTLSANGAGFRGGVGVNPNTGHQGEGYLGVGINSNLANGNGGGCDIDFQNNAPAGGGNGTPGDNGQALINSNQNQAIGGLIAGTSDLSNFVLGGGGGSGGYGGGNGGSGINGAPGGGGIMVYGVNNLFTGTVTANGLVGSTLFDGASASGAGGSIDMKHQIGGSGMTVTAQGGAAVTNSNRAPSITAGKGGDGRVAIAYLISNGITSTPAASIIQDNTLVTTPVIQVRLGISNDGTSTEFLTQNLNTLIVGQWERVSVSWDSLRSTASFFENGNPIGQSMGTKTAIFGTPTADFAIGANHGASAYQNFYDGLMNDVRAWNAQQTQAQISANLVVNLGGVATNLKGNWFLTNTGNDLVSGGNNVVATGTPTPGYVTDVPYPGATTRGDLDQTNAGTGFDYDLPTSLTENEKQTFVPAFDPQKSLQINFNAKGTGDVTLVVHDGLNNNVMTMTVANAALPSSGLYEFAYPQTFRPVRGATYHFHLWSTVNDGSVICGADDDPTTIQFNTYYQFLVNDGDYHSAMQTGNLLSIANERYVAVISAAGGDGIGVYNGQGYNPHRLSFPAGWRVRCMAMWRGQYAFGCWRGTSIKDFDQGIVFIWDGNSPTYNDYFFVPQGGINAMWGENGILYLIAGYQGDLLEYTGDLMADYGYDIVNKAKRIPKLGQGNTLEVAPGAIVYYDSLLRIGIALNSTGDTLERGVYTWGSRYSQYPKSLSYDVPISTGSRGASVSIGLMIPVGGDLLIFYQDGTTFGVNNYGPDNPVQTSGTIEGLITDLGAVYKPKELLTVRANHLPLDTGANVDVKYKIDYESTWHNKGLVTQNAGDITTRLPLQAADGATQKKNEYHAVQVAIDLYASDGISPTVIETGNFTDLLTTEGDETDL